MPLADVSVVVLTVPLDAVGDVLLPIVTDSVAVLETSPELSVTWNVKLSLPW